MRHVHRIKREAEQEAQQPKPELRQGELALEGGRAEAPRRADTVTRDTAGMQSPDRDAAPAQYLDTVPPVEAEDYPWAHAAAAQEDVPPPRLDQDPPKPDWHAPYEALWRDWSELIERVRQTGEPLFYAKGYMDMIPRIQALAENPDIPAETRAPMIEALENHQRDLSARNTSRTILTPPNGTWARMLPSSASPAASAFRSLRYRITWAGGRKRTV